jgi:hypothetical protein
MKKLSIILLISFLAVFFVVGSATAIPTLWIGTSTDAGDFFIIEDQGLGDINAALGAVTFSGSVDNFSVNVTTGITKPVIGSPGEPRMDLNSVNVSNGDGTLAIWWSDNDFTLGGPLSFESLIGGTTDGSVEAWTLLDQGNGISYPLNQVWTDLLYNNTFSAGAFSDQAAVSFDPATPYGLTLVTLITHSGQGQITSFDFEVNAAVPEPASMLMLGFGLIGLAGVARKKFFEKV